MLLGGAFEVTLEGPHVLLLDILDEFGDLLPLFEAFFVFCLSSLKEGQEVTVDEVDDKLPEVFESDCHINNRKLRPISSIQMYCYPA